MLNLSAQQFDALQRQRISDNLDEITKWLQSEYPEVKAMSFLELRAEVEVCSKAPYEWGIQMGDLIRLHVYASKFFGTDYWQAAPPIGAVLQDPYIDDDLKHVWFKGWIEAMFDQMLKKAA